ncbi:GNAT family N-acetyltransferase [Streptomyces albipurpureus]|uniref:GNAT family N-acetyltransferase n=1 Tax=Streptomyces albipurpureus TaxID=2897419 RepID=A0ABT0UFJ9_9ACTN|nr:GNAT family N-acetyltransferase [Streptomyces sp. CWNU-1]MCM2386942.1 GNAT family N-acetyltransferase [Streptomyces sp. CWNU-1]
MTIEDCGAVARIRLRGWQYAYAGLMPRSYLNAMSAAEYTEKLRGFLSDGSGATTHLVAEREGGVVGWACYGPCRDEGAPATQGEVYALYVVPEEISTGVGRALMTELTTRAEARGLPELLLWVVKGNDRARRFYEKAGFAPDGPEESFEVAGVQVPEVRYARGPMRHFSHPPTP